MKYKGLIVVFLTTCFFSCEEKEIADKIFINGNIYTVDENQPSAEAIAVKGERIIKVGSNKEVETYKGPDTEVIDF